MTQVVNSDSALALSPLLLSFSCARARARARAFYHIPQMTSIASSKGDVGAEMLASQIGSYFDLAIRIIEYHGGDVVKVSPCLTSQCELNIFCYE